MLSERVLFTSSFAGALKSRPKTRVTVYIVRTYTLLRPRVFDPLDEYNVYA